MSEAAADTDAGAPPARDRHAALRWRLNRLRCMSVAEIGHRVARLARMQAERLGLLGAGAVPAPDFNDRAAPWLHVARQVDAAPYLAAADRLAAGRFDIFALADVDLGDAPRWNRDPKSGIEAPLSFGKLLDYRDAQRVGDIKYLWEPNRHLHLVTLAQAHALSGRRHYLATIERHLASWLSACPPGLGPNWSSALEAALRLINWAAAWQLLGGPDAPLFQGSAGAEFRRRWLDSIHRHAQFIRGHFSLHSSANNHLIGEAAGLFIAALAWPHWPCARAWREQARRLLEREALLQNAADGVNREQAVAYQQFVVELLLLALLAGRENGVVFSDAYRARIEAMLEYLASIMDVAGNVPMFGDADDGAALDLVPGDHAGRCRALLATGAVLFGRGDFKAKARRLGDHARWLLGAGADAAFEALPAAPAGPLPVRRAFPDGGYYILGRAFEGGDEIRLVVDAGPLGYQRIAAHGHADALSFTLSIAGLEFLVDPGTYAYHSEEAWRAYFRGTAAHNTVRIDGCDQSEAGGKFMWLAKARAGCRVWREGDAQDEFEGWHDGYLRLEDPVMHRRRIVVDKAQGRIVIEDTLQMDGAHDVELFFHAAEDCRLEPVGRDYKLSRAGRTVLLKLPRRLGAAVRAYRGSVDPIAGWVSRRFDAKEPAPTLRWKARISGPIVLRSEIHC